MKITRTYKIVIISVAVLSAASLFFGWVASIPLNILVTGSQAVAHMELLGEYPRNISSVELTEAKTGKVIWSVVPVGSLIQVHEIDLTSGSNPTDLKTYWGKTVVQVPQGSSNFDLVAGSGYKLKVCSPSFPWPCTSRVFKIGTS